METIRLHPQYGAKIIGDHPRLKIGRSLTLTHQERWDGTGYPRGLRREAIPMEGRIVALGDQYDALRNRRVYKEPLDHTMASYILTKGDGRTLPGHFDPEILKIFMTFNKEFEEIYERMWD